MEKRTRKFEAIVSSAKSLFWKHGIKRVTIEEICTEAGVSRMTYYKYFNDKTAIAKFIIEDLFKSGLKEYKDILNSDIPYEEKVKKLIDLKMRSVHETSQELIDDIYKNRDEELFNTIENINARTLHIYIDDLGEAQKSGEIRADVKPEFILYILNRLTEMLTDKKLVAIYPNPEQMILEVISFFFYGIMPRKN
jgi:AcrR family transcriptional regulator